jgi:hypothetical protein
MQYVDRLPEPSPPRNPVRGDFDRIAGSWGRQFLTVPVGGDDSHVVVATADPLNVEAIEQLGLEYRDSDDVDGVIGGGGSVESQLKAAIAAYEKDLVSAVRKAQSAHKKASLVEAQADNPEAAGTTPDVRTAYLSTLLRTLFPPLELARFMLGVCAPGAAAPGRSLNRRAALAGRQPSATGWGALAVRRHLPQWGRAAPAWPP